MIPALHRKLLRDLWHLKGQSLAICLVIGCGVATFVMSLNTLQSLRDSQAAYYQRQRFADVFALLKRAPLSLAERIAALPGVAQVETRIVREVTLDVPGLAEPAVGRLISLPEFGPPKLNDIYLRRGRWIEPGRGGEVLVAEGFAAAHGLRPGDPLRAVINGRLQQLVIVGVVLSPEYILQLREGTLLPDEKRFGVFWMGYRELAAAFDMDGAMNEVSLTLMRGASEAEVIRRLDELLAPYGGIGAYGREDQLSHRYLSDEIRQLRSMGLIAPSIFLSVAAFLLNVVLSRQIRTQREQIAALKAFGYTRREVGLHYLQLVLLITLLGVLLGTVCGAWMGRGLTELYTRFYRFPVFSFRLNYEVVLTAAGISLAAAVAGTVAAVWSAIRLAPAEAMRPEPPADFRPTLAERTGLGFLLTPAARMILRNLERHPFKALLATTGIALAVAVLILGSFSEDALDYMIVFQFDLAQRQDVSLMFVEPARGRVRHEVARLPGVLQAEGFRALPVRLRAGHHMRRIGLVGLEPGSALVRLFDERKRTVLLPPDGLVLSTKLADLLQVRPGDEITVEVLEGQRPKRQVLVRGLVTEYGGLNAYMQLAALHRLVREADALSGMHLTVARPARAALYHTLKQTPRVASVTVKEAALQSFRDTVAENLLRIRMFNILFASVIAFGVVYNSARIALAERSRDLATLRVIGFTRGEISGILLGELAVLTLAAIPLGMLLGYLFAGWVTRGLDTELYRVPLVIDRSTYAFAVTVVLLAALFSGLVVRRKLDHLDLVAVLKTKG